MSLPEQDPILPLSPAERKAWVEAAKQAVADKDGVTYGHASRAILRYEETVKRLERQLEQC